MKKWKHKLHEVIFEADTPQGKLFDVVLLITILLSV
ncbi:MAG: ion transporter, partial [Flavobacteriaceae bacterium]